MKYGVIGEHLTHSFSKELHGEIGNYPYEIKEIPREELTGFILRKDFLGLNVTIPYKEKVIPFLDVTDPLAKEIGAVNTVVNRGGVLYGYNTDFYGLEQLILRTDVSVLGKKVAILGTGGTSKTAMAVCKHLGAGEILRVSRSEKPGTVTYDALSEQHRDIQVLINTTPVGMFPNASDLPVDISRFPSLCAVIDVIYNPLSSRLVSEAKKKGIPASGGLFMLVAQAVRASGLFLDCSYSDGTAEQVYRRILKSKENIVLIGMPSSGKTTVGEILAELTGRPFIDTDRVLEERYRLPCGKLFEKLGSDAFRKLESETVKEFSLKTGIVLATGGGVILDSSNIDALKQNGILYFIDRPLSDLTATADRPLSSNRSDLEQRYRERYPIYLASADRVIPVTGTAAETAIQINKEFSK